MTVAKTDTQIISTLKELREYTQWLSALMPNKTALLLKGPLGVGKTKTVEFLLSEMGCDLVVSPTFALHKTYELSDFVVHHFDLYRIESEADLESTGFWDVFLNEKGWIIVEWAERLKKEHLPLSWSVFELDIRLIKDPHNESQGVAREFFLTMPLDDQKK